ncbi:cyclic nucleotide-binding domain-containing protein 2-like [Spea bombifrons]|uniref:cyclic nucleotide-binding domain-containing protein 2-like n=1 Tax=Spea bombifrons TaxID=233779 RepID=UPI00234A8D26|nr:cyclic nucleotide-binding domain-containing protein 2-like [Spea bombifrons]
MYLQDASEKEPPMEHPVHSEKVGKRQEQRLKPIRFNLAVDPEEGIVNGGPPHVDLIILVNCLLLNNPQPVANTREESIDKNDNITAATGNAEYFLESNLLEDDKNTEQPGRKVTHNTQKCLHKFRTAVLVVQVIRNLIKIYRDYAASRAEPISFSEYVTFETENESLLFDRSFFKAKMEMAVSSEAQVILSSPPEKRSSEGIKLAMLSLRATVSSFAGYPVLIQEKIAKFGWYERFEPGRVIIRQGHVPQNFYLILSGTAVVTRVSRNKKTGEYCSNTIAFLRKGKYFGDVAILTNAKRNATVVCHDTVSLLAIARQDFLNIFLNSETKEGPEYMKLLSSIDLLTGWPVHKLPYNNPRICVHTFYRPGTVITKDSKASSKIYVIKTGSVRVLKSMANLQSLSSKNDKRHGKTTSIEETLIGSPTKKKETESASCSSKEHLLPDLQMEKNNPNSAEENTRNKNITANQPVFSALAEDERGASPIFIHIQTLTAGDVFGLAYTVYEDTLGMALVSDGAECIIISKEFFKKHMSDEYQQRLSRQIQPYPSKEMLQQKMEDYIKWKTYKALLTKKSR